MPAARNLPSRYSTSRNTHKKSGTTNRRGSQWCSTYQVIDFLGVGRHRVFADALLARIVHVQRNELAVLRAMIYLVVNRHRALRRRG